MSDSRWHQIDADIDLRPRRRLGRLLRAVLICPLCQASDLHVIAYRAHSVRLGCRNCINRFSIDPALVATALTGLPVGEAQDIGKRITAQLARLSQKGES